LPAGSALIAGVVFGREFRRQRGLVVDCRDNPRGVTTWLH